MVNKVMLVGRLGQDPEIKYSNSGTAFGNFSIATNEKQKNKETGQYEDKTEWHRIVVFGKTAENCGNYLAKGRLVHIEGKLQTRKWQDQKTGQDRYITEVVANNVTFLESAAGGGQGQQGGYQQQGQQGGYQQQQGGYQQQNQQPQQNQQAQQSQQGQFGSGPMPGGGAPF